MSWVAVAIGGTALIGGGVAMYEGSQNRNAALEAENKFNAQPDYKQLPEYSEATGARGSWWDTLQNWGQPGANYGANMPNYDAVYENAKKRINQYYWGGPSGGGLIDKVRAGAARRGVAESPAIDVLTQRAGVEQANKLGDISTELDVTKANAIETARGNWLNSLTNLAQLRPSFVSGKTGQFSAPTMSGLGTTIATAGTGIAGALQKNQDNDWYKSILEKYYGSGMPAQTQGSLTGAPNSPYSNPNVYGSGGMYDLGDFN